MPQGSSNLKFKNYRFRGLPFGGIWNKRVLKAQFVQTMAKNYTNYYGLIFSCPVGNEAISCDFKKIRRLKTKERLAFYNALPENEKDKLIENHQQCLSAREKKTLFHESQ